MTTSTLKQIVETNLKHEQRSQAYLAKRLGYLPDQFNRWLNGVNRIPYEVVGEIAQHFRMMPADQVALYEVAGYPFPAWARECVAPAPALRALPAALNDQPRVHRLESTPAYMEYLQQRLRTARVSVEERRSGIDGLGLSPEEADAYRRYGQEIIERCQRRVVYRGVVVADDSLTTEMAAAAHRERLRSYNLRTVPQGVRLQLPLLNYIIVDGQEIICSLHNHPSLSADREMRLSVRQPDLVALFRAHFDAIWAMAQVIKEGDAMTRRRFDAPRRRQAKAAAD